MKWQRVQTKPDNSEENSDNSKIDLFFDNCKRHLPNPAVMIRTQQHPGQARARIISPAAGEKLIGSGWRSADLHVHTCYSYDVVPVAGARVVAGLNGWRLD